MFAAIDVLEFPELHDESIPFMAFTKCLTRLMGAAGVRDFSLQVESCLGSKAPYCHAIISCGWVREEGTPGG